MSDPSQDRLEAPYQPSQALDADGEQYVSQFLSTEIKDVLDGSDRQAFLESIDKYRRMRMLKPEQAEKSYPWQKACFPPDVELLTEHGWKFVADISEEDRVLSREPETGKACYQPVTKAWSYDHDGKLIHFKNNYVDLQTTPEHKFLMERRYTSGHVIKTAQEILDDRTGNGDLLLPLVSNCLVGAKPETLHGFKAEDFMEFYGWWVSEGWVFRHENKCVGIGQSITANPEKVAMIVDLLERMGLKYAYINESQFIISLPKEVWRWFRQFGTAVDKKIPRELLELHPDLLKVMFKAMMLGDGHSSIPKDKHRNHPSSSYMTVSKQLSDDVQELLAKIGLSGTIHPNDVRGQIGGIIRGRPIVAKNIQYPVQIRYVKNTRFRKDRMKVFEEAYKGKVYCVTTEPWHTVYARQNGKAVWTMNSNLVTPIMAQKTNVIYAKLVSMFSTKRPFWSCLTNDKQYEYHAEAVARYMNLLAKGPFHLNIDNINRTLFYDLVSLGTQVVRVPWLYEEWQMKVPSGTGTELVSQKRVMHNGPALVPVRLEDFLCRNYYEDIQRAPWVGFRNWLTFAELKQREQMGIYANVDEVQAFYAQKLEKSREDELARRGFEAANMGSTDETKLFPIIEAFVFYDADGDGVPEDIKVWIEVESGVILRSEANLLGVRDAQILRYFKLPGQLYGMGVGHLLEGLQEEADFLHNHRIDNLHLSLMPIYKRRTGSMQAKRKELHPGAILDMDDINDLQPLVTPDLTGSSFASENLVRDYADRISGANDPMSGYADPVMKSGSDVGSTMFLAQQGNSILNAVYDGIENDYNGIGQLVLMQCVANKDRIDLMAMDPRDAQLIQEVLAMPLETLPTTFKFAMETTDISRTEETKRQNIMQAGQLYTQYGQQMMQLLPMAVNPQVPPPIQQFAMQLFAGATEITRQALDFFHITGSEKWLPQAGGASNVGNGMAPEGAGVGGPEAGPAVSGAPAGPGAGMQGVAPGVALPGAGPQGSV